MIIEALCEQNIEVRFDSATNHGVPGNQIWCELFENNVVISKGYGRNMAMALRNAVYRHELIEKFRNNAKLDNIIEDYYT